MKITKLFMDSTCALHGIIDLTFFSFYCMMHAKLLDDYLMAFLLIDHDFSDGISDAWSFTSLRIPRRNHPLFLPVGMLVMNRDKLI